MKKLIGVAVLLLSVILFLLYRQLTHRAVKVSQPMVSVPAILRENMMLSSVLFQ